MPFVEKIAHVHHILGGGKFALFIMQFGGWLVLYLLLVWGCFWMGHKAARWTAGITSYFAIGLMMPALAFYAVTPAMNLVGVAYLTLIWPLWTWFGVGVPEWLAPHLFTFD